MGKKAKKQVKAKPLGKSLPGRVLFQVTTADRDRLASDAEQEHRQNMAHLRAVAGER